LRFSAFLANWHHDWTASPTDAVWHQDDDQRAAVARDVQDALIAKRKRRQEPSIPKELTEITQHARMLATKYRKPFDADRRMKDQVLRLERALLPPRRGRPRNQSVTRANALYRKLPQIPEDKPRVIWIRINPLVVPDMTASRNASSARSDKHCANG
jgi:hypothetical protein